MLELLTYIDNLRNLRAVSVTDGGAILTWGPGSNADSDDEEVRVTIITMICVMINILLCSGQETCHHS